MGNTIGPYVRYEIHNGKSMPYKSDAQRRFFHSPGAAKAGITAAQVAEFDRASKGKKLPKKVVNVGSIMKRKK